MVVPSVGTPCHTNSVSLSFFLTSTFQVTSSLSLSISLMSGGRGGRGGGGYKAPTGGQLFLKRSAQECGLDDRNLRTLQDITKPLLFPTFKWHSSGTPWTTEDEVTEVVSVKRPTTAYLIRKGRDMNHRMQSSPYYLRPTQDVDVVRYKKQHRPNVTCDKVVLEEMGHAAMTGWIPAELLGKKQPLVEEVVKDLTSEELAAIELKAKDNEEGEGEEEDELLLEQEGEEDDAEDYVTNHYESEGDESDGGGDAEPTF